MTEKSEERIYREAKKRIDMRKNGIHPSDYFEGWVVDYIDSSATDKLSVEKLQEIRVEELKDFNSKILQAELKNQKLQEQLNTAKNELTEEIESIEKYLDKYGMSSYGANTRQAYLEGLKKALAAIEKGENNEI